MLAQMMTSPVYNAALTWFAPLTAAVYGALFLLKAFRNERTSYSYLTLHLCLVATKVFLSSLLTLSQFVVWANDPFTHTLTLSPAKLMTPSRGFLRLFAPLYEGPHGYFIHYALVHFWLDLFWGLCFAALISALLFLLRRVRPLIMTNAEAHFIGGGALVLGWPLAVLFFFGTWVVFLVHVSFVALRHGERTAIFPSAAVAFASVFFFGTHILSALSFLPSLYFS